MQEGDLFTDNVGEFDETGIEGIDTALGKILEKTAQSDEVIRLRDSFKTFTFCIDFAVEGEAVFTQKLGSNIGRSKIVTFAGNFASEVKKTFKIAAVVLSGFDRAAVLDFERLEEIIDELRYEERR